MNAITRIQSFPAFRQPSADDDLRAKLRRALSLALDSAPSHFTPKPEKPADHGRLRGVAMNALTKHPRNWDAAKDSFLAVVRKDPELLWALFEKQRNAAIQQLLTEVAEERHQAGRPIRMEPAIEQPRPAAPKSTAVARLAQRTLLDTFKINGKPVGDLTPAEANQWAGAQERDARFVRLLTQNLPPDLPIRKFRTGDEAVALYAQAEAAGE
jgi:hypothetical protein